MNYTPYISNPDDWKHHFVKMAKNNTRKEFYTVSKNNQSKHDNGGDVQIVSPTQQSVEQAKENLKRTLNDVKFTHVRAVKRLKQGKSKAKPQSKTRRRRSKK